MQSPFSAFEVSHDHSMHILGARIDSSFTKMVHGICHIQCRDGMKVWELLMPHMQLFSV